VSKSLWIDVLYKQIEKYQEHIYKALDIPGIDFFFLFSRDSLVPDNGGKFSTKDDGSCARTYKGAWWYKACYYSHLNGLYANSAVVATKYLSWYHWGNKYEALKRTSMMIRPW
jgi:hypothetical protein